MKLCKCDICRTTRKIRKHINILHKHNLKVTADFFEKITDNYLDTSFDLDHANAVIDGSWPHVDEYIKQVRSVKEKK